MKVLQILPELNVGGVETGTVDFAKYLVSCGHQSIVVSAGGALVSVLEQNGTKHYGLPVHKKSLWTIIRMVKRLRRIIEEEKVDIVHARSRVPAWIAYFACRRTNASFVTTCHGFYKNRLFSQVMGWAKLVIVPSAVIGRHMIDEYKVPPGSIRCIPRSVDLEKFNIPQEARAGKSKHVVAIVGRITPLKGHPFFIQAMAAVIRRMPYTKVWIAGDAPAGKESYKQELEVLVKRLGLKDSVEFLGNRRDIPRILSQVDVLVFSSVVPESFGRAILEAQAAGVPVVATRVGGVIDIIDDGKTGLLVPAKDPEAIAREVLRLLNDKELSARLVEAAYKKLKEKFTIEHMASQTLKAYEGLVKDTHILVIKISSAGDVVLATASLRAIRRKFPQAKVYCLTGKESRKILQNCPYLDGLIIYDPFFKDKGILKFFKLASRLRKYRFDKIIDLQNNRKSHLLSFLSFPRESYGYDNGKGSFLLNHPAKNFKTAMPPVAHQFQILKLLGINEGESQALELWPSRRDEEYIAELFEAEWLGNARHIVGIHLAAKWKTKNWPIEYMAKLCDLLSAKNIRVIITGAEKDKPILSRLLTLTRSKPSIFVGKTDIVQLAALVKRCQVFITPDSAPLHVAAAVGTPAIAFFGPTDSSRHTPPGDKIIIMEKKPSCAPCYNSHCRVLTHVCMKEITVEEVERTVESLLMDEIKK